MMPAAELLAANDHLATCEACYQRFGKDDQLEAAYSFVRANLQEVAGTEVDHPVYEQLAAYVDQTMSRKEAEILESHIELCNACEVEVSDLRALKATLYSGVESTAKTPQTLRDRLSVLWRVPVYRMAFQAASLIAIAAVFVWIATIPLRTRVADLQRQLTELRQDNEQLRQEHQDAELAIAALKADLTMYQAAAHLSPSAQPIVLALNDGGGQVTLDTQGRLEGLNLLTPSDQQMVKTALTTQRVASAPIIARLKGEAKNLMGNSGGGASFNLLSPVATVVETDRPTFQWASLSGAAGYIVTVYKSNSKEVVATSPLLMANEWQMPHSLKRGGIYAWQVRALKDGEEIKMPAPGAAETKFKILEQARAEELERAKQMYAGSRLMLGILYAQAGLLDNAEQEFQALAEANPHSRVAQNLLRSVKAMRRR
jgi:anti-sigma factor RsiW